MYSGLNADFYQEPGQEESLFIDTAILPPLYTPVYYPPNPWYRQSVVDRDFIVLAEFSEQEGPKPLMCIPQSGGDGFDLNAFSLRIMSVDTQSMTSKFSMPEDTQVVLSETRDGIYAYVHHFTLHDSQARGFVRPYCMAYVTPDRKKIMTFYESLNGEFNKVSRYLKYGNLRLFHKHMTNYLADLKHTKERVRLEGENVIGCSEEAVELVEKEIEAIVATVKPLLSDRQMERRFRGLDRREREGDGLLLDAMGLNNVKKRRPPLARRSISMQCERSSRSYSASSEYQPRVVNVHRRTFDRALRDLHALCEWGAREGIARLREIHKHFGRDVATLLMEEQDSLLVEPRSCMLSVGGCITVNFLHKLESGDTESGGSRDLEEPHKSKFLPSNIHKWDSTDTLESFKSGESFFSLDSSSYDKCHVTDNTNNERKAMSMVSSPSGEDVFVDARSHIGSPGNNSEASELREGWSSDTDTSPTHLPTITKLDIQSCADHVDSLSEQSPGCGLLKLFNQFSADLISSLLSSLLRGRPVCVLGRLERDVRHVVSALTLLVPGYPSSHSRVVPCQRNPVRLSDLAHVKLVGLIRTDKKSDNLVPETLRLYVTILDLDKRLLRAPIYDGCILKNLYHRRKHFSTDAVFLSHLHCFLLEVSMKAFRYYHEYCLPRASSLGPDGPHVGRAECREYRLACREAADHLTRQGLRGHDILIIQYFAEVVIFHQTEDYYTNVVGLSDAPASSILLDLHQPVLFKG